MTFLFLDTCLPTMYIGILKQEHDVPQVMLDAAPRPSERLQLNVQTLLHDNQLKKDDISGIIITTGPGSFTGVRVGIAFAEAWRTALGIPVYPFTTMAALSISFQAQRPKTAHTCVLDTLTGDVYAQSFQADGTPEHAPACLPQADLPNLPHHRLVGHKLDNSLQAGTDEIDQIDWSLPALYRASQQTSPASGAITPLYVKLLAYRKY